MKYLLLILVFYSCTKLPEDPIFRDAKVSTEYLVKFKNQSDAKSYKKKIRTKAMERANDPGFYIVENVSEEIKAKAEWIVPNVKFTHQSDPYPLWGMQNIQVPQENKGNQNILVGVIDEGIFSWHEDLCGQVWVNPFDPVDGVDNDGNGYIDDTNGWDFYNNDRTIFDQIDNHGSHVAGIIGAKADNALGVYGVSPHVKIISAKFLEGNGSLADAVLAMDYLTDLKIRHKLNIVATNNSYGGVGEAPYKPLTEAIQRAAAADILVVCAAGNAGTNNDLGTKFYPASDPSPNVISVAAIGENDQLASFSNYGDTSVDIAAPGVGIYSTVPGVAPNLDGYAAYNGTSMAAPHVTGAAVLYKAKYPTATYSQIKNALLSTSRYAGLKVRTGGILNVSTLTGYVSPEYINQPCPTGSWDSVPPSVPQNFRVTGFIDGSRAEVKWDKSADVSGIMAYQGTVYDSTGKILWYYQWNQSQTISLGEADAYFLTYGVTYTLRVRAVDKARNFSLESNPITINTARPFTGSGWYRHTMRFNSITVADPNNATGRITLCNTGTTVTTYSTSIPGYQTELKTSISPLLVGAPRGWYSDGNTLYYVDHVFDWDVNLYREYGYIANTFTCPDGTPPPTDTVIVPPPVDNRSVSLSGYNSGRTHYLNWTYKGTTPNSFQIRSNTGVIQMVSGTVNNLTTVSLKKGGSVSYTVTGVWSDKSVVSNSITLKVR
jgi:hypothetical protein